MLDTQAQSLAAAHAPSPAGELVEANVRLERRVGELLRVLDLAQGIAGELRLDALLDAAVATIASLTGAHAVAILLPEPDGAVLTVRARRGGNGRHRLGRRIAVGEGLAGWVAQHHVPLLLPEAGSRPDFDALARAEGYDSASFVGVPLLFEERLLGVVCVAERAGGLAFHEHDLRVLICLAPHLAVAIRNAALYEEMEALRWHGHPASDPQAEAHCRRDGGGSED